MRAGDSSQFDGANASASEISSSDPPNEGDQAEDAALFALANSEIITYLLDPWIEKVLAVETLFERHTAVKK